MLSPVNRAHPSNKSPTTDVNRVCDSTKMGTTTAKLICPSESIWRERGARAPSPPLLPGGGLPYAWARPGPVVCARHSRRARPGPGERGRSGKGARGPHPPARARMASFYADSFGRLAPYVLGVVSERPWAVLALALAHHVAVGCASAWATGNGLPGGVFDFVVFEPFVLVLGSALAALHVALYGSVVRAVAVMARLRGARDDAWIALTPMRSAEREPEAAAATKTVSSHKRHPKRGRGAEPVIAKQHAHVPDALARMIGEQWPGNVAIPAMALYEADPDAWEDVVGLNASRGGGGGGGDLLGEAEPGSALPKLDLLEEWGYSCHGTDAALSLRPGHEWSAWVVLALAAAQAGACAIWAATPPPHGAAGYVVWALAQASMLPAAFVALRAQPWLYAFKWRMARSYAVAWGVCALGVAAASLTFVAPSLHPRWTSALVLALGYGLVMLALPAHWHFGACAAPGRGPASALPAGDILRVASSRVAAPVPPLAPPVSIVGIVPVE